MSRFELVEGVILFAILLWSFVATLRRKLKYGGLPFNESGTNIIHEGWWLSILFGACALFMVATIAYSIATRGLP